MNPLSIIVPIYNVEKYLKECLDSIQTQTYQNFQAVLINDGSKDNSLKIAQEYAQKDSRFIIINQENMGLGEARNSGLNYIFSNKNKQDTKYIGLIDSDDVIARDYYSNLIYCLESNNTLVAKTRDICVFKDENYNKDIFNATSNKEKGIVRQVKNNELTSKIDPWRSVFNAELIKGLRFPKVRFAEDVPFGVCVNVIAKRIALTKGARYFYRIRADSLTKKTHPPTEFFGAFKFIYDFFLQNNLLTTYTLPIHILRPNAAQREQYPNYFNDLQDFIKTLNMDSQTLKKNKDIRAILESNGLEQFLKKTQNFTEWRRENFRIHFSKKHKILRFFGKTIYQK